MADGVKLGDFVSGSITKAKEKDRTEPSKVVKIKKSMVRGQIVDHHGH